MKLFVLLLFFVAGVSFLSAQEIHVSGSVIEAATQQPIPYATVTLINKNNQKIIAGTTSDDFGKFKVETITPEILIKVSFMGFIPKTISAFAVENNAIKLGVISLEEDTQQLEEVIVEGEISQTQFKLDKRIFNVGTDLSSTGAGALEVLRNVPSVNVNIEGQISLRGSQGVQILINGKPSVIASDEGNALGTITADMIDRIEVITNPSAKYDAEGTSGIINIVLKKDEKKGLNGSVTLNVGVPNNHSLGFSMNNRSEKFNFFGQLGIGKRTFPEDEEMENTNLTNNRTITSTGDEYRDEAFLNLTIGTDYHIDENNILTLSGSFAYEKEKEGSDALFLIYDNNTVSDSYDRDENTKAENPKYLYELQYKKDFEGSEKQTLLFSALGNFFRKDQFSEYKNTGTEDQTIKDRQKTRTDFSEAEYTFKLDYTHPLTEKQLVETGTQYQINDVSSDYAISEYQNEMFVENPDFSNVFDFIQNVLGVYGTWGYEEESWGVKLGLRMENTDIKTKLHNTNEQNDRNYTDLFPSGHASYKVSDNFSLQTGYSRRIFRPRLWNLNPFVNIQNTYNLRTGNPDLNPEYTDSYELTSIYKFDHISLNAGVFYRYTDDVIERIIEYQDNVSISKPENVGTNNTFGFELNTKYIPTKWLTLTGDFNFNSFKREGSFKNKAIDFNGDQWFTTVTGKFKFPANIDFEMSVNYNSSFPTIQQNVSETWFLDLGARKKILKGKAIVNLSIRDLFATRIEESIINQPDFHQRNYSKEGRFITIGISFGFGKGEAMEFSGQKRF